MLKYVVALALVAVSQSGWRPYTQTSEMTDEKTAGYEITADKGAPGLLSPWPAPVLTVACQGGRVYTVVAFGVVLNPQAPITIRFDKDPAIHDPWKTTPLDLHAAVGFATPAFLHRLATATILKVEFTPSLENAVVTTFTLAAGRPDFDRLAATCRAGRRGGAR